MHCLLYFLSPHTATHSLCILDLTTPSSSLFQWPKCLCYNLESDTLLHSFPTNECNTKKFTSLSVYSRSCLLLRWISALDFQKTYGIANIQHLPIILSLVKLVFYLSARSLPVTHTRALIPKAFSLNTTSFFHYPQFHSFILSWTCESLLGWPRMSGFWLLAFDIAVAGHISPSTTLVALLR